MKNAIRHITIYLLTAIVLIASIGISACCMFGCHDVKVASGKVECCEKELAELSNEHEKNGCPDCQPIYVSLDADYLLYSAEFKINLPSVAFFQTPIIFSEKYCPKKITAYWEQDLPPPPYGKVLLPFIQSFLC